MVDSDSDPVINFREVRSQIQSVSDFPYPVPSKLLERASGPPTLAVMTIPWIDRPGNLETLCLPVAVRSSASLAICVEEFAQCANVGTWPLERKRDQMKLRSLLAVAHSSNPFIGLGQVWRNDRKLIPATDSDFDQIAGVLEGYR